MNTPLLLLVEDDADVRAFLEDALIDAGFALVIASTGREALAELGKQPERFCAVVTDIKLGLGPDGWEVARVAREAVPDMPLVYMSGDSAGEWPVKGVPNSIMVAKPFAVALVINAVASVVNQSGHQPG